MGLESPNRKGNEAKQQVQVSTDEATRKADPTSYSILPPDEMKKKIVRPLNELSLPVRTSEKETYYEVNNNQRPQGQRAIARMLKGILNVSDVVATHDRKGRERLYSWKLPTNRIKEGMSSGEFAADQMILEYIFNSRDHIYNSFNGWVNNGSYQKGKGYHFDFGEDAERFLDEADQGSIRGKLANQSPEARAYLLGKAQELQERFAGIEGRAFLKSIVDSSGVPITELFGPQRVFDEHPNVDPLVLVHNLLTTRIDALLSNVKALTSTANT